MGTSVKLKGARVLFLCSTDNMIWQFLIPHIKDLQQFGATVDCVCTRTGFWFDRLIKDHNFNMIEVPMCRLPWKMKNFRAYKTLVKLQKENKYDMVFCQQPVGGMLGRFLGRKFNIPVVYTAHGFFFFKGNNVFRNILFKTAEKIMARWSNTVITMNDEDFEATQKFKCKHKFKINGIGLDLAKYQNEEFDAVKFKESLGVKENEKIILSVSEFIKRKNYTTMIKSFARLAGKCDNVQYVICGTGEKFEEIKKLTIDLGVENRIKFLGYRTDINKIMQVSDVFYHQSFHEGLTMSVIEAMHFGLPVVVSNVRGNKDLIDEIGGIITRSKDIEQQTEALQYLLSNESKRKDMGEYNKRKSQKYLINVVRQQLKDIYQQIGII